MSKLDPKPYRGGPQQRYWYAQWTDEHGKQRSKSLGPVSRISQGEARRRCRELHASFLVDPSGRTPRAAASITLAEFVTDYLAARTLEVAPTTLAAIRFAVRPFAAALGERKLNTIGAGDAEDYVTSLRRAGLAPWTIAVRVGRLRHLFAAAVRRKLITENPFTGLSSTAGDIERATPRIFAGDVARVIAAAKPRWALLLGLCAYAGLRRGEAMRIRWGDVQVSRRRLRVAHEGAQTTKRRSREVLLIPELETLLELHRGNAKDSDLIVGTIANVHRQLHGETYNGNRYISPFEVAGIPLWPKPLQSLRAWRATEWRAAHPDYIVDAWLGHSLSVARRFYVQVPESAYGVQKESDRQRADRLEAELAAIKAGRSS